ncbi:MAG: HlyD family secretion protein [Gammaproteobacteria bacterium]|nr:HlyD family secretion protein [Gammaproteobacteria bacterium]MBU2059101.1 HlyD family secretion protein [Gammaproteobacteria bacterium]MBU2173652.1 HlyD family secretion protein [Gammaproteobacteria bacterium]MBU2246808.1 HlyD family secretion protein [Gammaproteobacteria bacterium]MBU2343800.1 HlyD family secretion protein [Gammaproteobacteria bacterium]
MTTEQSLFRPKALQAQQQRLEGQVSIVQPVSSSVLCFCLVFILFSLLLLLHQASFSRKETVSGYLKPSSGVVRIHSQRPAVLKQLYIQDGTLVQAGQKLALLSSDEYLAAGESLTDHLQSSLALQLALNTQKQHELLQSFAQQSEQLSAQITNIKLQLAENQRQQQLLSQRIDIQNQRLLSQQELALKGHVPKLQLEQQQDQHLMLQQQLAEVQTLAQSIRQQQIQWENQLQALPLEQQRQLQQLQAERLSFEQQKTELLARKEVVLTAPVAGRVTNLVVSTGQHLQSSQVLMQLLPESGFLYAQLLVPTRAFGFIQPGQTTWLRFDAFPYQRFGLYQGEISQLSKAVLMAQDPDSPVQIQEPVYQVQVQLNQQFIEAYGEQMPLQAGMLLSADIVLEQRSVLSWLLEPLVSLRGRFQI